MFSPRPMLSGRVQSQADAERGGAGISDIDLLHFLKNGELVLRDPAVTGFLDNNKIFVLLHLLDNAVHVIDIFIDLTVNKRHEKRLADFLHTFHHFIVIVNVDQTRDHPLVLIFTDILVQLRHILERHRDKVFLFLRDLQELFPAAEAFQRYTPQLRLKIPVLTGHFQLHMVHVPLRVHARMDLGEQTVQIFLLPLPFHQRVKGIVRPQDAAVLQRNGVGHRQLLQERILDPLILGRELDQIRQNQRPVVKIQPACEKWS